MKAIPYQFTVAWSEEDQAYEATVPALRYVVAYGDTPEEAIKEVTTSARAALNVMEKEGKALPALDATLDRVMSLQPLLNVSAIAKTAGISVQTLSSKIKRGTAFTPDESSRIGKIFTAHGIPAICKTAVLAASVGITYQNEARGKTSLGTRILRTPKKAGPGRVAGQASGVLRGLKGITKEIG
jgi:predicted RNase H-like HicB family nuclease